MRWLDLSSNGRLYLGDFGSVRVDPLQARTLGNLRQVLQGQRIGLNFRQAVGSGCYGWCGRFDFRRMDCGRPGWCNWCWLVCKCG